MSVLNQSLCNSPGWTCHSARQRLPVGLVEIPELDAHDPGGLDDVAGAIDRLEVDNQLLPLAVLVLVVEVREPADLTASRA